MALVWSSARVRQGWPTGGAPYGYQNVDDRDEPIKPHPVKSKTVIRIFELYATGQYTFKTLADQLAREGHIYRESTPRFLRSALSYILSNPFYVGELHRNGQVFAGKYQRLIDRRTFDACQEILNGRNRRTGSPQMALSGGLFRCAYCGQSITGERIRRKLLNGNVNEHDYYRCANNDPDPSHPKVRWRAEDLEDAIVRDLSQLRIPSPEVADWFRKALAAAFADIDGQQRQQTAALKKRQSELKSMQERLLNAYLAGTVESEVFQTKSAEIKTETMKVEEFLDKAVKNGGPGGDAALAVFDFCQNVGERWRGSNKAQKRQILDLLCLNRVLDDVSLVTTKRKPFDVLTETPKTMGTIPAAIRTRNLRLRRPTLMWRKCRHGIMIRLYRFFR